MPIRSAEVRWRGKEGTYKLESGQCEGKVSFASRFEQEKGSNPEELIAAAQATCFSMALTKELTDFGFEPESIHTWAKVSIKKTADGFSINAIDVETEATVPNISEEKFQEIANSAKENCPVSKLLKKGATISLHARLLVEVSH